MPRDLVLPEAMPGIADPAERAKAAERFIAYAEGRAKEARIVRDAALRELRARNLTRPQIAAATGINVHTVKGATR